MVRQWATLTEGAETAESFAKALYELLKWSDGQPYERTHAHMSQGLNYATVGLAMMALDAHLISKNTEDQEMKVLALGPKGTKYALFPENHDNWKQFRSELQMILTQRPHVSALPQEAAGLRTIAEDLCFKGAKSDNGSQYQVKHFARSWLLVIEKRSPNLFDGLSFSDVHGWVPDSSDNLGTSGIAQGATYSEVRKMFGCSPLLVTAIFCYLFNQRRCPDKSIQALLDEEDANILKACHQWMSLEGQTPAPDGFTPIFQSLAKAKMAQDCKPRRLVDDLPLGSCVEANVARGG